VTTAPKSRIPSVLRTEQSELLRDWTDAQLRVLSGQAGRISESDLRDQCREFLQLFTLAAQQDQLDNIQGPAWQGLRDMLAGVSQSRAKQGFTPVQTATFVLSLKPPLFDQLRRSGANDGAALADDIARATTVLDQLALQTIDVYVRSRDDIIRRQQDEMLELSTPVVKLWEGILAVPMIGTLDSARTQVVMETLLQRIVETGAQVAIIDITGVPTVDTLVAQHLLKTVTAARLMGADCIISGIRPQIAQTIVHLGVALGDVVTKASLADAFAVALQRRGVTFARSNARS
jgi:rsbT co-antagonist protein RsbR